MARASWEIKNDPSVAVMLVVGALFMLIILMAISGEMGRRSRLKADGY